MLWKASAERVHKAATVRRRTIYLYCCITNLFTLACPPLSSIAYNTEHLVMLGSSLGCSHVGDAPKASEILDRRSFNGGAFWCFFFLNNSALQQLSKLLRGKEDEANSRWRGWEVKIKLWSSRGSPLHWILAGICKTHLLLGCGDVRVCLHCCCCSTGGGYSP